MLTSAARVLPPLAATHSNIHTNRTVSETTASSDASLIPWPAEIRFGDGFYRFTEASAIRLEGNLRALAPLAALLADALKRITNGRPMPILDACPGIHGAIVLRLAERCSPPRAGMDDEGYTLDVTTDGVTIESETAVGIFYGIQTLQQLLPLEAAAALPFVHIEDKPRYPWRGMHLDCVRHFMPVPFLKKLIDVMAAFKFNTFHWHLTDDQGWRLESKRYPRLTEIGAWRSETVLGFEKGPGDGVPHGGFYTCEEAREIVDYAAARFITVVPEIEMPGHATAALAAYPEYSCTGGPFAVATEWGVFKDVFCIGNDATLAFLESVIDEVLEIFPSTFIHVGGDECPKERWRTCPKCQARMRAEGLADEDALQSWIISRMSRFLRSRERRLIGWDEILEGGLAEGAAVMSWRGEEGGIQAANAGHDVVMTPGDRVYFNFSQDRPETNPLLQEIPYTSLESVYQYEPTPANIEPSKRHHVIGAQGQLWTEYMPSTRQVEYMAFPRALALAEVLWSPSASRDYEAFTTRLASLLPRLDAFGVNYRQNC